MPEMLSRLTWVPGIAHWMLLAAVLFSIGLYGVLCRRSAVGVLMASELLLNSAALSFVIFNHYQRPSSVDGQIMAIFVIAVAASEVVLGMAIYMALFRVRKTVDVNELSELRNDEARP